MSDFAQLLWRALWDADLFSVPELYVRCQTALQERACFERQFLVTRIGETVWRKILNAWDRPDAEAQATGQLGLGAVLTEFLAAPAVLSARPPAAVAHLGTLANLLVGVYDDLVDAKAEQDPLPQPALQALLMGREGILEEGPPMVELAVEYFRQLNVLPGATSQPQMLRTLGHAILKMYVAERATLNGDECAAGWQRKVALPFVVMALPAWLADSAVDPSAYRRHLRWLCRCGEFWGWVDDALDLTDDAAAGHPNRVQKALKAGSPCTVAVHIAHLGRNVLADWRRMTPQASSLPIEVQEALPTCLFAALSHSLSRKRKEVNE